MQIRKMSQSELDLAIKQELERVGGYDNWRKKEWRNEVSSKPPQPRPSTKAEQYADACKLRAEYHGVSLEQLFRQEPELYENYRRLVHEE